MAKKTGVPNRHTYSRISFLYQAAACLSQSCKRGPETTSQQTLPLENGDVDLPNGHADKDSSQTTDAQGGHPAGAAENRSRQLITDLRNVSHKSVIRISPGMKRTICKYCDTLLVEGQTCSSAVENKSKGGKKPWADVLVIKCHTCGGEKRFPVNTERQKKRPHRAATSHSQPQKGT